MNINIYKLKIISEAKYNTIQIQCIVLVNCSKICADVPVMEGKITNTKTTPTGPIHLCYSRMSLKIRTVL